MAKVVAVYCFFRILFLLTLLQGDGVVAYDVPITSCARLPYPGACLSLTNNSLDPLFAGGDQTKVGMFREFNIRGAILNARRAIQIAASSINTDGFDPRTRSAWDDCIALSNDSMEHLQNSMAYPSSEETQTWLSAIMANHQTCIDGFSDFNISYPVAALPLTSGNTNELLSNLLAINKASMPINSGGNRKLLSDEDDLFPEWLEVGDRRLLKSNSVKADLVVAKDGSGNYKTIKQAVKASAKKQKGSKRFVIYIKAGVYSENVEITKSMKNLMFVGDGIGRTVVTGRKNVVDGSTTFKSATVAADGKGFIAKYMTFQNTAGPEKHQAVAFRSSSDQSVFYRCSFKGYQDTLYLHSKRQFYRECKIYGTVDFIFGDAAAVLQKCKIYVRKPMKGQKNTITAQGRRDKNENTGISIQCSKVTAAPDLKPVQGSFQTYLGRPWKKYSRTVFMECYLGSLIAPAGWLPWNGNFALDTLYYGEYRNTGPGANTSRRVNWKGYHVMSKSEASKFTVGKFLPGGSWIAHAKVPFEPGLNCRHA